MHLRCRRGYARFRCRKRQSFAQSSTADGHTAAALRGGLTLSAWMHSGPQCGGGSFAFDMNIRNSRVVFHVDT